MKFSVKAKALSLVLLVAVLFCQIAFAQEFSAVEIINDPETYTFYFYTASYNSPAGFRLADASVGQYVDDPREGNLLTSTVYLIVDSEEIPVSLWHLYINNELIMDVPVYNVINWHDSVKKM